MSNTKKKASDKSESPVTKIIIGTLIALIAGGSSPWWWAAIFPKPAVKIISAQCSPEILKDQLFAASERAAVIKDTAKRMKEKLAREEFECVSNLSNVLLEQDHENGHGLYFQGETWRFKATDDPQRSPLSRDRMREYFLRYIANEGHLSDSERSGDGKACYEREKGYCRERTAWINHLMAVDYLQWAADSTDKTTKVKRLELATMFLTVDLDFGGFDKVTPSVELKGRIAEEFKKLGADYPTNP